VRIKFRYSSLLDAGVCAMPDSGDHRELLFVPFASSIEIKCHLCLKVAKVYHRGDYQLAIKSALKRRSPSAAATAALELVSSTRWQSKSVVSP
jgi:hypothetical protein